MSFAATAIARHDAVRSLKSSRFQVCCLAASVPDLTTKVSFSASPYLVRQFAMSASTSNLGVRLSRGLLLSLLFRGIGGGRTG
jgi:hypothetical protein